MIVSSTIDPAVFGIPVPAGLTPSEQKVPLLYATLLRHLNDLLDDVQSNKDERVWDAHEAVHYHLARVGEPGSMCRGFPTFEAMLHLTAAFLALQFADSVAHVRAIFELARAHPEDRCAARFKDVLERARELVRFQDFPFMPELPVAPEDPRWHCLTPSPERSEEDSEESDASDSEMQREAHVAATGVPAPVGEDAPEQQVPPQYLAILGYLNDLFDEIVLGDDQRLNDAHERVLDELAHADDESSICWGHPTFRAILHLAAAHSHYCYDEFDEAAGHLRSILELARAHPEERYASRFKDLIRRARIVAGFPDFPNMPELPLGPDVRRYGYTRPSMERSEDGSEESSRRRNIDVAATAAPAPDIQMAVDQQLAQDPAESLGGRPGLEAAQAGRPAQVETKQIEDVTNALQGLGSGGGMGSSMEVEAE